LEVKTVEFWKISLRGFSREVCGTNFRALLWRLLLALSGPACIVCPLLETVKDRRVDNWG
jgi:hypothetical protein